MSGFHGGHSGGGGFHGGHSSHSSHSHSSSHSYSHSSHSYGGHNYNRTTIFIGGASFNRGSLNNNRSIKKPSLFLSIVIGFIIVIIGINLFLGTYSIKCEATVTDVKVVEDRFDGSHYEEYTFMYERDNTTYYGRGDDELVYYSSLTNYGLSTKVGEVYPIYVRFLDNTSYSFESTNGFAFFLLFASIGISTLIIVLQVRNLKLYNKRLEQIGDLNGDGKLDEKDLEIYFRRKTDPDYMKPKEPTTKICSYCNSIINIEDRFCENCGASQAKE